MDTEILKQIVSSTDSGIVLIFVIFAVALVPVFIFLMKHTKHRHEVEHQRREQERARENHIIQVITSNTEAMTGLNKTLEIQNENISKTVTRIHERIDKLNKRLKPKRKPKESQA